jgi:hypothetical protein
MYGIEVAVSAGETLFQRGDRSTDLDIVLNGEREIHLHSNSAIVRL